MKEKLKVKIKSYKFWTSLAAGIVVLVELIGRAVGFIPNGVLINDIIMAFCGVLIVLGVVRDGIPKEEELLNKSESEKKDDDQIESVENKKSTSRKSKKQIDINNDEIK